MDPGRYPNRLNLHIRLNTAILMKTNQLNLLSNACFVPGSASIIGSIVIWYMTGGTDPEARAHGERFGIFVGLWAPTFFILSNRFDRYAFIVSWLEAPCRSDTIIPELGQPF